MMKLVNTLLAMLVILLLLTCGVSASTNYEKKENAGEELCYDDKSEVIEETAGLTDDGKDVLIKRTVKHFKKDATVTRQQPSSKSGCYSLMGIKWTTLPVTYTINPTNTQELTQDFITTALSASAETWDAATSKELFNNAYTVDNAAVFGAYDGKNVLLFGNNEANANVIAITSTWYTLISKKILDFDVSFEENFQWGDAISKKMDIQNIATHELGHGIGLKDLYNTCTQETMYGYSSYGETIKRTLNPGDIAGLKAIYR